ncbi:hypothetical protein HPB48_026340 [Haemaphysalis longicornis]|uniref:Nlr family card domain protein n=1 Tax=Haemaphysalis longicornis TaxID=44386 RepID=A0A9J6HB80_HAELO|nr:hypothetical protein HPB48_026340 [Haemaphysalis longicornis]
MNFQVARLADSGSSAKVSAALQKSPTNYEEHAVPIRLSAMESLNGCIIGEALDFRLPCTATENAACQIVGHLSAWNEFFFLVSLQLREMPGTNGKLSLQFMHKPGQTKCSPRNLRLVSLLMCELLKTHRCVAHIDLEAALFSPYRGLLSDCLRECPSIRSLRLAICCDKPVPVEDFATAAFSLPHLQELECTGKSQNWLTCVARLPALLRTTTSLTALRVSSECLGSLRPEEFFRALAQNCSLKELVLPCSLIFGPPPLVEAAIMEWLTNSTLLKSLTLVLDRGGPWLLKGALKGLLGNRSIVSVHLRCSLVDHADICLLSEVFEQNKALQILKISYEYCYYSFVERHLYKADCDCCLKALVGNHTLKEVALPIDVWDEGQWRELFEALPAKRDLQRVGIEAYERRHGHFLGTLCAALKETGADEKVSFKVPLTWPEFHERSECKAFSSLVVKDSDRNRGPICNIFRRMPSLGHITYFHLGIVYKMDSATSSALATFLSATLTLKTLSLSASWRVVQPECQKALLDGLAANSSLRELRMDVDVGSSDFCVFSEPLADVINASRNISRLHLRASGRECAGSAFLGRLTARIAGNYTLLSATVSQLMDKNLKRPWFEVSDATRRNCGLLTGAADFARGARRDRRCALALERMQGHPELVEEVARLEGGGPGTGGHHSPARPEEHPVGGCAPVHVAGRGRQGARLLPCQQGRQHAAGRLNEHCWRAIRRYLRVHDIRDPTAGSLPPQ